MLYARIIATLVLASSLCMGNFLSHSTFYGSASMATPYINDILDLEDDYNYTFGLRKIALFPYQERNRFYKGSEQQLTDKAIVGAVNGIEYLFSYSSVRNQGHNYDDAELWLKWSNNWFVTKTKYVDKGSRDLQFFDYDARFRLNLNKVNFTVGGALRGHPVYGHPAYNDYDQAWWFLAYDYGYIDYSIPGFDLNDNGIIDDPYYVWIETDPDTEDGYWIEFYEGTSYYWEDADGNQVANSDAEFEQYHLQGIVNQYNQDQIDALDFQSSASIVIGLDYYWSNEDFYFHTWSSIMPISKGLTDYAFVDDTKYEAGILIGYNIGNIGLFLETNYLNMFKEQYTLTTGLNYKF